MADEKEKQGNVGKTTTHKLQSYLSTIICHRDYVQTIPA